MHKNLIALGLAATMAVAAPAYAQNAQQADVKGSQAQGMKGQRAVIGQVVDTREIQLKGVSAKHRLVKIKNKQNEMMVINVGDATKTPAGKFKKGAMIVAVGKEARISGKPVLYAKYVGDLRQAGSMGSQSKTQ